jgi:hypothetical protein
MYRLPRVASAGAAEKVPPPVDATSGFLGSPSGDRLVMRPLYFDAPATQGALDFLLVRPLLVGMDLWDREALTGRGLRERSLLSAGR